MQVRLLRLSVFAVALVAFLGGCAVHPPQKPQSSSSYAHAAQSASLNGSYEKAGKLWVEAARRTHGSLQAQYALKAAQAFVSAGQKNMARGILNQIHLSALSPAQQSSGALLLVRIDLQEHRPNEARKILDHLNPKIRQKKLSSVLELTARAQFASGNTSAALSDLIARSKLLASSETILKNDKLIWHHLMEAPSLPTPKKFGRIGKGWIALARIGRTAWQQPYHFDKRLQAWRKEYPGHPATKGLLATLRKQHAQQIRYPKTIALLLPLSGAYSEQARAVENGFLAAYYKDGENLPNIKILDTDGTDTGAADAYKQAIREGATFIVGPLTPSGVSGVDQVVHNQGGENPILALNYLKNAKGVPSLLFQFGLSPSDEAREDAIRAIESGRTRAVILVPDSTRGTTTEKAFSQKFTSLGGHILGATTYRLKAVHFSEQLNMLFGLNGSNRRAQTLESVLGQSVDFTPRRRQDIQMVFFVAPFQTARLLKPQIDYYQGLGLPVYSLSDVYQPLSGSHPDLNGVRFPIMPWYLAKNNSVAKTRRRIAKLFPSDFKQVGSLYALGFDSYRLIPLIDNFQHPLKEPVRGVTGLLSLGRNQIIHRHLYFAIYRNGNVEPLTKTLAGSE